MKLISILFILPFKQQTICSVYYLNNKWVIGLEMNDPLCFCCWCIKRMKLNKNITMMRAFVTWLANQRVCVCSNYVTVSREKKTFSKCDEHPRTNCSRKCVKLCENLCHYCYLLLINLKKCLGVMFYSTSNWRQIKTATFCLIYLFYNTFILLNLFFSSISYHWAVFSANNELQECHACKFFMSIVQILCKYAAYLESSFWNECMGCNILQFSLCVLILCVCVILIISTRFVFVGL